MNKLSKIYYKPENLWKGKVAVDKLVEISGMNEKTVKEWIYKQAIWQIYLPAPKYIPRHAMGGDELRANDSHQADLLFLPHDTINGKTYKYALTVIDVGSRYKEAEPLKTKYSSEVAKAFETIYTRSSLTYPKTISIDSGGEFKGEVKKLFANHNVKLVVGEPGNHRAQGIVERFNKTLAEKLFPAQYAQEMIRECCPSRIAGGAGMHGDLSIHNKLDKITKMLETAVYRLDNVERRLSSAENEQSIMKEKVQIIDHSMEDINISVEELRASQTPSPCKKIIELELKIDDLVNRSCRNNVMIWGIPEGSEVSMNMKEFVLDFFLNFMKIEHDASKHDIEIERAYRSPAGKCINNSRTDSKPRPRPIHVKLLRYRDREKILRAAPKCLKDKVYQDSKIFITDDVSKKVRRDRQALMSERNKLRKEGDFAVVPWSVPACLLVRAQNGKSQRLTVADLTDH